MPVNHHELSPSFDRRSDYTRNHKDLFAIDIVYSQLLFQYTPFIAFKQLLYSNYLHGTISATRTIGVQIGSLYTEFITSTEDIFISHSTFYLSNPNQCQSINVAKERFVSILLVMLYTFE